MKRTFVTLAAIAALLFALSASAAPTRIFEKYETVRQALLDSSLDETQQAADALANTARGEEQPAIAARAKALAATATLKGARDSFSMLSEEVIRFRDRRSGDRPAVAYCSMYKASWLQPEGAISNPYAEDKSMLTCGEFRKDPKGASGASHGHH